TTRGRWTRRTSGTERALALTDELELAQRRAGRAGDRCCGLALNLDCARSSFGAAHGLFRLRLRCEPGPARRLAQGQRDRNNRPKARGAAMVRTIGRLNQAQPDPAPRTGSTPSALLQDSPRRG